MDIKNNFGIWDYEGESNSIERGVYAFQNGLYSLAMSLLRDFAEYGDVKSQSIVGKMFYDGLHVEKNTELGVEWFYHSAIEGEDRLTKFIQMHGEKFNLGWNYLGVEKEIFIRQQLNLHNVELVDFLLNVKGDINAQFKLGSIYCFGEGVTQDYKQAAKWFTLAAEQGNAVAQDYLGVMYYNGNGVERDFEQAVKWYTLAAEQGNAVAQYNLGLMYYNGNGVERDFEHAVKWFTLAAEQGVAYAQFNLGLMYDNGQGVTQDNKQAVKWYTLAAEQGNAVAQLNLGAMYDNGQGVTQDNKQAVKWYTLAAEQGVADAQLNLGAMYKNGQGVTEDNIYAHMWFNIASSNGCIKAPKSRDTVAKDMTKEQIAEAQKLARECVAKDYKDC